VHHDLWNYDIPAPPNLVTIEHEGKKVDAVAQVSKQGFTYVLDRETGEPIFPIEEREVPTSDVPGEQIWKTQPFPLKPPPFSRQSITEVDITDISPEAHKHVMEIFKQHRSGPIFNPLSFEGTLFMPGTWGGAQWSGAAFDPETGLLYVNAKQYVVIAAGVHWGIKGGDSYIAFALPDSKIDEKK